MSCGCQESGKPCAAEPAVAKEPCGCHGGCEEKDEPKEACGCGGACHTAEEV